MSVNIEKIIQLQKRLNVIFPQLYFDFLCEIEDGDVFEVEGSGICIYSCSDLEERNQTYQINEFEPNYFLIGQDGDLGILLKQTLRTIIPYFQMIWEHWVRWK